MSTVTVYKWNKETDRFDIPLAISFIKSGRSPLRPSGTGCAAPSRRVRLLNKKFAGHERRDWF